MRPASSKVLRMTKSSNPYNNTRRPSQASRWWHEDLVNFMVANPGISRNELAKIFNRTPVTIGLILNSDMFKAMLRQRQEEAKEHTTELIETRLRNVASKGLGLLEDRLSNSAKIPTKDIADLTDKTLSRLGYGIKNDNVQSPVTINMVSTDVIAEARERLMSKERDRLESTARPKFLNQVSSEVDLPGPPKIVGEDDG